MYSEGININFWRHFHEIQVKNLFNLQHFHFWTGFWNLPKIFMPPENHFWVHFRFWLPSSKIFSKFLFFGFLGIKSEFNHLTEKSNSWLFEKIHPFLESEIRFKNINCNNIDKGAPKTRLNTIKLICIWMKTGKEWVILNDIRKPRTCCRLR